MANPITNYVRHLYHSTNWGHALVQKAINLYNLYLTRFLPEETYIKRKFKAKLGYDINLKNPQTLNEKLNWLKLHDRKPLYTQCADKYAVRSYIKEKIGEEYLVPLFFMTQNPKDITIDSLPDEPCVIKTNHDSGGVHIIKDKNQVNFSQLQKALKKSIKRNYYYNSKEWQYKDIEPKIIVEKLLNGNEGELPYDYKVHCINGKARMIQVDLGRGTDHHHRNWYDINWNREPYRWSSKKGKDKYTHPAKEDVQKPLCLDEMIKISEKISTDFIYVRIDWYEVNGKLFFGEITLHHDSGFRPIEPKEWDLKLGQMLTLPTQQQT